MIKIIKRPRFHHSGEKILTEKKSWFLAPYGAAMCFHRTKYWLSFIMSPFQVEYLKLLPKFAFLARMFVCRFVDLSGYNITDRPQTLWHSFTKFHTYVHLGIIQNPTSLQNRHMNIKFWILANAPSPIAVSFVRQSVRVPVNLSVCNTTEKRINE